MAAPLIEIESLEHYSVLAVDSELVVLKRKAQGHSASQRRQDDDENLLALMRAMAASREVLRPGTLGEITGITRRPRDRALGLGQRRGWLSVMPNGFAKLTDEGREFLAAEEAS